MLNLQVFLFWKIVDKLVQKSNIVPIFNSQTSMLTTSYNWPSIFIL